jgi:acyl carrier protein
MSAAHTLEVRPRHDREMKTRRSFCGTKCSCAVETRGTEFCFRLTVAAFATGRRPRGGSSAPENSWLDCRAETSGGKQLGPAGATKISNPRLFGENPGAIELIAPLRYTGEGSSRGGTGAKGRHLRWRAGSRRDHKTVIIFKDLPMPSTFETVANIIAETCDIPRDTITPESHATDDLGIDSLDVLDIAFAIDKAFGNKLPLEQWTQEVNDGKATTEQYFVLENLCARIDELVAAKGA